MKICVFRYICFASKSCGFEGRHVLSQRGKALKLLDFLSAQKRIFAKPAPKLQA